ncbi:MAG: helix-turn-helix transcriptional regulator [Burkholderiaceae bacterium]
MTENHDILVVIGENLRRNRKRVRKSQDCLADECQMSRTYLGAIERGEANPTAACLVRLSKVLRIQVYELLIRPPVEHDR